MTGNSSTGGASTSAPSADVQMDSGRRRSSARGADVPATKKQSFGRPVDATRFSATHLKMLVKDKKPSKLLTSPINGVVLHGNVASDI